MLAIIRAGEAFEITLDFDNPNNQPNTFVTHPDRFGFLAHRGERLSGIQTRSFIWVPLGSRHSFSALCIALEEYGRVPEGQWLAAFRECQLDGNDLAIADRGWEDQHQQRYYPCRRSGSTLFLMEDTVQDERRKILWLVEVSEPSAPARSL